MLSSIRVQGNKDIRKLYENRKYRIYIVRKSICIKRKNGRQWILDYSLIFNRHKLDYLKYKLSSFDGSGREINTCRLSSCITINDLLNKDYPLPDEILQEMDDFLDATELFNEMEGL